MSRDELDTFFNRSSHHRLGIVAGGSLSAGMDVKLDTGAVPGGIIEDMAVGKYVVIQGQTGKKFFSIVTDIALDHTNPDLLKSPPADEFTARIYAEQIAFGRIKVAPMLVLDSAQSEPRPVKTIPAHFSPVYEATEEDVNRVFGKEDATHWHIGWPLDMGENVKVTLNLPRFVERSSGVFGKSGTGKSFITRIILAGIIKAQLASCLIFDMHNDYGWQVINEHGTEVKGLHQLFNATKQVSVITLDPETSDKRKSKRDGIFTIGFNQIEAEDVEMLAGLLALTDVQVGALFYLERELGPEWVTHLLEDSDKVKEIEEKDRLTKGTLRAIQRKLGAFHRFGFLTPTRPEKDMVVDIFERLSNGVSVILEFGVYGNQLEAYVLVANYLTRRIHERYVEAKNKSVGQRGEAPKPLVITIEEAHKFLDPAIAQHTIFGTIARELRKYNVTLLLVDQRPSGIDEEVMSQIGTRVTCLLDNEADIRAVFSGVNGASQLREVLARLDTKQQALILGHAVPMPVVVKTRSYDETLYAAIVPDAPVTAEKKHTSIETSDPTVVW